MEGKLDTLYLKNYLINHEVKPSTIRISVLEYLLQNRIHPTADDIYRAVSTKIPTLSKTSIYNAIDLFIEKDIIHVIAVDNKENRYDIDISTHGHFACRLCNRIFDFYIDSIEYDRKQLDGFIIEEQDILLKGICRECTKMDM